MQRARFGWFHRGLSISTLVLLGVALSTLTIAPAQAAPAISPATGDTLTLVLNNGPTFTFVGQPGGTPAPLFTATVQFAAKPTRNWAMEVVVQAGGQTFGSTFSPTVSPDGLTYTFSRISAGSAPIPAGTQSAVATFYDAISNTTLSSTAVPFTVVRATPLPLCVIYGYTFVNDPGQSLQFHMTFQDNALAPVDWQDATYTIRFVGNAGTDTVTDANLVPNSQAVVTTQAPSTFDWYSEIDCTFNGTANFAPATTQAAAQPILVSARHPLGTVHFTSNPWPWQANTPIQVDIKMDAAPGGPVPDGFVCLTFGNGSTNFVHLGANGELLATLPPATSAYLGNISEVFVQYQGDPYYNEGSTGFPVPTPTPSASSTPSGGGSGTGTGTGSSAGATATSASTPGATGTQIAQSASGLPGASGTATASRSTQVPAPSPRSTGIAILLAVAVMLILGGGAGSWLFLAQRTKRRTVHQPDASGGEPIAPSTVRQADPAMALHLPPDDVSSRDG